VLRQKVTLSNSDMSEERLCKQLIPLDFTNVLYTNIPVIIFYLKEKISK